MKKLLRSSGRMVTAISLSGQATTSQDSGEASGTIILGYYPEAMHRTSQLLFEDAMGPTDDLLSKGHMTNLAVQSVGGINRSLHSTVGHYREEGVNQLFGRKSLPVISANTSIGRVDHLRSTSGGPPVQSPEVSRCPSKELRVGIHLPWGRSCQEDLPKMCPVHPVRGQEV